MIRNRQVHLDFHTNGTLPVGKKFSKEQFQAALKLGHVDSITVFSKCHHGWSYHPTEVNEMHPTLSFDLLGAQLEACKEINHIPFLDVSVAISIANIPPNKHDGIINDFNFLFKSSFLEKYNIAIKII